MQPGSALANKVVNLVAGDVGSLGAATAVKLHLASAAFVPSLTTTVAGLTEATFAGYAAIAAGATGLQQNFFDPATGNGIVEIIPPLGGWHWVTASATGLPQTLYGSYLTDNGNVQLWGSQLFQTPIVLTASGQGVDVVNARFTFPPSPMS